ncbi:pantoate--beta-alanine ligase [uncultured Clostridium sp.]|uniref:pantoate--beta-alanine ligase n=1 Tax=uncultured Clostridium sp. TaxID=59620 RepID=UPI0026291CE5|nr:pantoate--beta-alanine ligase [uncultured Clostridium sp.]
MICIDGIKEIRETVKEWRKEGLSVGFVPTMGYLHEGHESLVKKAKRENDRVIVSIFVNPTQFGVNEDLDAYPRNLENDKVICKRAGANIIFNPKNEEMYFADEVSFVDMNGLTKELCGKSRPIHFRGVCTVVTKLFNIVKCDRAYFGQKDAQQLAVIKRMVRDLNMEVEVISCLIIREDDGLAKSSRNIYLSKEERKASTILNKALKKAKEMLDDGELDARKIELRIKATITMEKLAKIDYIKVVDSTTISKVNKIENEVLVAIAIFIGKTRLIDNFIYKAE